MEGKKELTEALVLKVKRKGLSKIGRRKSLKISLFLNALFTNQEYLQRAQRCLGVPVAVFHNGDVDSLFSHHHNRTYSIESPFIVQAVMSR